MSPFPKSWSLNYSPNAANEFRKGVGISTDDRDEKEDDDNAPITIAETNESSIYSTASQEKRHRVEQLIDDNGCCTRHPTVKLVEKKRKPRLSKLFGKQRKSISKESTSGTDEWTILLEECPECNFDSKSSSKRKSSGKTRRQLVHEPFAATISIVESHPDLPVGSLALQIRSDSVCDEQTRHLSCMVDETLKVENAPWSTPDGALDFILPCDVDGNVFNKEEQPAATQNGHQYHIMERIIPLSSIDHISRGGDAWDVLRHSVGQEDLGCQCDLKIHGFSDRLLRFDVIGFCNSSRSSKSNYKARQSFAVVDFLRSSVSFMTNKKDAHENDGLNANDQWDLGNYTKENVMAKLNSLVMWDRERRKTGVDGWADCFASCLEEYLSLGVASVGKNFIPVVKKKEKEAP